MHVTFVKKILADGSLCKKCHDVSERLESDKVLQYINHIVIADERDGQSPGMRLALEHKVSRAPFFLVENDAGEVEIFDVYFKFRKHLERAGIITKTSAVL